jgi:uncharacterized membrane protein
MPDDFQSLEDLAYGAFVSWQLEWTIKTGHLGMGAWIISVITIIMMLGIGESIMERLSMVMCSSGHKS